MLMLKLFSFVESDEKYDRFIAWMGAGMFVTAVFTFVMIYLAKP
jgi:hypothetical protein